LTSSAEMDMGISEYKQTPALVRPAREVPEPV
jgi:hypothetical protein